MRLERTIDFKQTYAGFAIFLQNFANRQVKKLRTRSSRIRHFSQDYASLPSVLNTPIKIYPWILSNAPWLIYQLSLLIPQHK